MELLRRNLGYKILSLALGILLYAVADAQRNPRVPENLLIVPRIENAPPNMAVRGEPASLSVTVTGPSSAIQTFRNQSVKAVLDLRSAQPGMNHIPIRYQNDVTVLDLAGALYADVVLEKKARTTFHVDVLYNNTPPPGLAYNEPVTDPPTVSVSGLASDVSRVVRVVGIVDNNDAGGVVRRPVDLVAQNTQRETIDGIQIEPSQVRVTITTRRTPATKSLLLSARLSGTPAPGFALAGYRFDPPALTVSGTQQSLAHFSSLTVPVSVDGLRGSVDRRVTPTLPSGMTLDTGEPNTVNLQIDVRAVPTLTPSPTAPTPAAPTPASTPVVALPTPLPLERNP